MKKALIFISFFYGIVASQNCLAQPLSRHPISSESEIGATDCKDTLRFLKFQREYDIGIVLPSWKPIVHDNYIAIVEGIVDYAPKDGRNGPHVSHEEFPFYHYTHDFNFSIVPDVTPDNRFTNLLPYLIYEYGAEKRDTVLSKTMHVEWETGLGMGNIINPTRKLNSKGKSYGFFTAGHEQRDIIWNFPSVDDWVHVEGHYVWDRGHPPARAEIHPARFIAIKRNLPEKIFLDNQPERFATRFDIFASGDGGALKNNRSDAPDFVKHTKMSSKDYTFTTTINLPKPHPAAKLNYITIRQKGDNFSTTEKVLMNDSTGTATFILPWRTNDAHDIEVFARTIYLYWEWGNGVPEDYSIAELKVDLSNLQFKKNRDTYGNTEYLGWVNVGSNWLFLNDFLCKKDKVISSGLSNSHKKEWQLNNSFTLYVPKDKKFRVYMNGWEADGVEFFMGDLLNPNSPCTPKTKRLFKRKLFSLRHMLMPGCVNDELGEVSALHSLSNLIDKNYFKIGPKDGINDDPCPFSKYPLKDTYFLGYSIERK